MNEPLVSIIVPAYNSEKTIKKCIDSLLNIDYPSYEIIIIDDGSTDRTREILEGYKGKIKIIESQHSGPSKCRNIAIKQSQGGFIAFTDSDCTVDRNWLKELISGLVDEKIAGAGGIQLSPNDETIFGKRVQSFFELTGFFGGYIKNKEADKLIKVEHNPSCNVMYRKSALIDIGGFDESLWPSEDVDLDYRLKKKGYDFMFHPAAKIFHYRPQTISALLKMMLRYGAVQAILVKRYGFFRRLQLFPLLLAIFLIACFVKPYLFLILLVPYFLILLIMKRLKDSSIIFLLAIFSCFSWVVGFLKGLLTFRK